MKETKITPMLRNYMGDDVSAAPHDAEWFRVEVKGLWLGDFPQLNEANHWLAAAFAGEFPAWMRPEYADTIRAAIR